jgi:tetratricopeptide (TPR) repeat protein
LGLYEEAAEVLTKGIALGDHPAIYSYRAFSYRNLRRYPEALADIEKALKTRPHDPFILKEKAYCLVEMGDAEKAYETILMALRYDPQNERLLALRRKLEESSPEIKKVLGR